MLKRYATNLGLVLFSFLLTLGAIELILRMGVFDHSHVWTPEAAKLENKEINRANYRDASSHPFRFNDVQRSHAKPQGVHRLAVLGDSFIWGDGIPSEKRWSKKLERLVTQECSNIEVLHWGRNGWSTVDEYTFLIGEGLRFSPDYVVLGVVTNDPDLGSTRADHLRWQDSRALSPIRTLFPNALNFISGYANAFIYQHSETLGGVNWENRLYGVENLHAYSKLLKRLSEFTSTHSLPLLAVFTPTNHRDIYRERYESLTPLFQEAQIPVLNLFPATFDRFREVNADDLKANRANNHPGDRLTSFYSEEVFRYMKEQGLLRVLSKGHCNLGSANSSLPSS